jgi:hypothetical protein
MKGAVSAMMNRAKASGSNTGAPNHSSAISATKPTRISETRTKPVWAPISAT